MRGISDPTRPDIATLPLQSSDDRAMNTDTGGCPGDDPVIKIAAPKVRPMAAWGFACNAWPTKRRLCISPGTTLWVASITRAWQKNDRYQIPKTKQVWVHSLRIRVQSLHRSGAFSRPKLTAF